ncbi:MAG: hypothetical protein NTU76_02645, partial [Candidatus Taylorbacteria bacterium]|nr:hypothetical protein [Candidatus Taylorbacteria bacterium]
FSETLANIGGDGNSFGWQKISQWEDGTTRKIGTNPRSEGSIFTGVSICNFASFALYDGLSRKLQSIDLDVVKLYSDFRAEDWNNPNHQPQEWDHELVKITLRDTGEIFFLDPTYKQINHNVEEPILVVPENKLTEFYKDRQKRQPESILNRKDEILKELEPWGLSKEQYQTLVETLFF